MHLKKVAQLLSRSMHFATELAEFYISYNSGVLSWYTLLIGWVLHGLLQHLYLEIIVYFTLKSKLLHNSLMKKH